MSPSDLIEWIALPAFITGLLTWAYTAIGVLAIIVRAMLKALQAKEAGE